MTTLQLAETACEAHLLGAILRDSSVMDAAMEELAPADFSEPMFSRIYKAMLDADAAGEPMDCVTLSSRAPQCGDTIQDIHSKTASSANAGWYIRKIREASLRRRAIKALDAFSRTLKDPEKDPRDVIDNLAGVILDLSMEGAKESNEDMLRVIDRVLRESNARRGSASHVIGLTTHLPTLDKIISGFQRKKYHLIAGYSGQGKTALAMDIVSDFAEAGLRGLVFSQEMSREEMAQRSLARKSGISSKRATEGSVSDEEWKDITGAAARMAPWINNLVIDERPTLTPIQMLAKARREHRIAPLEYIVVDYIQLMSHHDRDIRANTARMVSECSKALMGMAKTLNLPIIVLSQLRKPGALEKVFDDRTGAKTQRTRPTLDMLKETGQIENDAHVIIFVHEGKLYIDKNRGGPSEREIDVVFHKECSRFYEVTEREES